ncbi:Cna B-type domain-containing protein [Methanobrevibacter sp. YE315]|uniref:Cna B-type domain-containing protein n=1 Tax=Methanobrevibacter sp. YE315 TaxID=1609968 RepID=UPI00082ABEA9|nr:Cna B-type domain-containing protein [Methanobrevibacter sp. YE315]
MTDDHDGFRPDNVTFVLLANGNETANVTLSGAGNVWTASFNDLPVYANGSAIVYTIKELTVEYYNSTVTNSSLSNYTITNSRIVEFTSVNVTKVWNDSDDHDGFRPQNVTFVLLANGNETANVTLSGTGNVWTASFNDLPVYANGSAIVYTIKELTVEYYNSTVTNASLSNYTITNSRIVEFTSVNVTKVWNDSDDHDGFRPDNVTFVLLANGNETANVTLSGTGNVWTASFNDLPVYANGSAIVYTIKELTVEYYNSTVTNASLSNYTITNSRIVEFTSVNVTKVWNDSDDHDGFRPQNVTFVLLANGNETANVTLSGTGNVWTASFNDLPVYANGSAIVYTIKELTVEYYNSTVTNASLSNYTITNSRIVEFTSVNVTKVWNDSDDHDGFRPQNVTFVLLANGNETANVTLSGAGNVWTASFNDLPVYANGSAIVYTIKELTVEYYNSTVTNSSLSNYTITNSRIVEFTSVNVTKVWNDSDDHDGFRPQNVTFVLLANGNETANVTLSGTGNVWTASFNDLPVYANGSAIVYTIKELTVEYYNSTVTNASLSNYTITNSRIVEFTSVNVTKVWNDSDDHDGFRPDNVTFVLLANGNETANVTLSGTGNVWTASFNDLPVYANGSAIVYTIKELTVEYYNSTVTNASLSNYTITNSRIVEFTSVNVTKVWNDSDDHDGFRPQNVTFVLLANGNETANVTLSGTGNVWTASFNDLPVYANGSAIVYTIKELTVEYYNSTVTNASLSNYTITNSRIVEFTSVNVTKVWNDSDDHDGFRPQNVTFVLLANGNETANVTLSGTGNVWTASFNDLPVYANGSAIVYTIKELTVEYYNSTVTNASLSNYTITNSRIVEFTSVNVTKVWNDSDDHDGFRPQNVTFVLLANGNETANVTLSGTGNVWTASFNDLPVYANGSAIVYTIKELTVEYYNSTVTNASLSNYTITNSRIVEFTSVNVTKVWNDSDDHDGFRPQNVTFVLLANGNETANVTLSGTGNVWTASFNDLPVYANGSAIVYTIKELTVEYYNSTVTNASLSNYTITNSRIVEFTSVNVTKVWNDSDDHDGFRPQNVTFVLLANGNETANVTLSGTGNVWTASFNDLPVYANGSAIVYTIKELTVEYYNSTVTNASLSNYTITNSRIVEFTSVNVTKVWNDSDDHDGFRPQNVTFVLLANGNETANVTLSGTGNVWTASFNDLPVYANGSAIVYTIKELTVEYYNSTVTNASLSNYTITNTRIVEYTSVNVTKVWNDSDDKDKLRPNEITVELYNGVELIDSVVLNQANNWKGNFTDLPVYKDGKKIVYTVAEIEVDKYNSTVTNSTLGNYTITNTHVPYKPNMTVEKITLDKVVFVNDTVKFLIVVTNTGDCDLTDVTVYEIFKSGELDYNDYIDPTGKWSMTGNYVYVYNGTLTAGESANFTVVFTALTNGTFLNAVNASSNKTDNKTGNNTTTVYRPNMTVQKITLDNVVFVNDTVRFLIVVTNTGDCDLTDVKVTEIFKPKELKYNSYIDSTGKWSKESDYVFVYDGNMTAGGSANFTVVFTALTNGTILNTVNASSNETDNKTGNNTTEVKPICDLEITKSVNPAKVYVNDTVVWTIEVVNHGPSKAENVVVYDTIPDGLEFSVPQGCTFDGKYLIWNVGDLDVNKRAALELITKVTREGNITNIVVVNSSTPDSNESNNEANNTTVVEPICDLVITKLVNASSVNVNETVEWNVTVVNKGPSLAMDVVVREILQDGLAIISAAPSAGSFDEKSRIWEIGELDIDSPVSLILVTKVLTNGTLTNVVVVNSTTPDSNESNNKANNTTVANPICDLEIVKLVNASEVNVSDIVEWTITVKNNGPSAACDVVAKDTLPDGVKLVEVPENCRLEGNTVIWTIGILPAYDRISLTLLTQVLTEGNKTNIVIVNSTTPDSNESNNRANNTTDVYPVCDLEITKLVNATEVYVNDVVEWTVVVKNNGPSTAKDVVVKELLPEGIELLDVVPSVGDYENGIWTVGDMEMDASATLKLITKVLTEGIKTNVVSANSTTPDSNKSNNKANNTTNVNPICDLEITKMVNATEVNVTDFVEWTITVVNNGPSIARDVVAVDTLPDGVKLVEVPKNCRLDGNNVIWTIGDLNAGNPVSITLLTQVLSEGIKTNIVVVNSTTPDSNKTNNKANNTTEVKPVCDLEIIKLVSSKKAYVGEELTWTIIVINHGPSAALDVEVLEDIPSSLKLTGYTATEGTYDKTTNIWTIGKLDGDASATLTIVTEVLSVGNITNPVEAKTSTPDSNKTNNKANNTTEASEICDLELKKSSDKKAYYVGDQMHWIIEVVNHGPSPARDVVAYDVLSSSVRFISYSASKGSYDASTGRWDIGELAKGESVTLDILCEVLTEGMITNYANVTTSVNETNLDNNYDNATVEVTNKTEPVPEPEPTPEPPVTLKETGNPIAYLLAAVLTIFGSCWLRKKQE